MSRIADPEKKRALCARLARIEGQLRGLQNPLKNTLCLDQSYVSYVSKLWKTHIVQKDQAYALY